MTFPRAGLNKVLPRDARTVTLEGAKAYAMGTQDRPAPLSLVPAAEEERRSDLDLLVALRADLPWARREVWERYSGQVRRYLARALARPTEDVEDLTQEVFLRVFVGRAAIRRPEALREFTMGVAVRVLKWNLRSRWVRRRVRLSEDGNLPEVVVDRSPEEETRDALRRCRVILEALGARERAAFTLRFMEEMTMEEVAATMRVSLSTAKRLCSRATATIAELMRGDEDLRRYFVDSRGAGR
jgi:RNA polymerase sigma-70 factor (ECF subfamily)